MNKKLAYIIATFFGVGYCPIASGTAGSLATLPVAFALSYYGGFWALFAFFVAVYVLGTIASKEVLKYTEHDPSIIVIDEVAGQLIPLMFVAITPITALVSFVLFRVFDIWKPFPANYFDKKVHNEHGVMLDDIVAGLYALLVVYIFSSVSSIELIVVK